MVPPKKVLSMEVVPLNRIKWLSTLVPPKTHKITEFLTTGKNSVIFCVLGGTSVLSNFFCWGTPLPYLELFWVKPFEEEKTPCMRIEEACNYSVQF